jgi:hypothetical protein
MAVSSVSARRVQARIVVDPATSVAGVEGRRTRAVRESNSASWKNEIAVTPQEMWWARWWLGQWDGLDGLGPKRGCSGRGNHRRRMLNQRVLVPWLKLSCTEYMPVAVLLPPHHASFNTPSPR